MVIRQLTSRASSQTSYISLNPSTCYSFEGFIFTSTQATGITSCCLSFYYFSFQAQIRLLTLLSRAGVASSTTYSCADFRCSISPTRFAYPCQMRPSQRLVDSSSELRLADWPVFASTVPITAVTVQRDLS